jgi:[1-hydroxy-2-(trimethylamino)ethyl]phosphonate dioxygenase
MTIVDEIISILEAHGNSSYFGEPVSQTEHALQAAYFAESEGASETLVAAALVHDLGHLLHNLPEHIADAGVDARHEHVGHAWLAAHFPPAVYEPVKMHVAAKRYLCATDPDYFNQLSPASVQSLGLQGGAMSKEEVQLFEANPFFKEAVQLRRWDDKAKVPELNVPGLSYYRDLLTNVAVG